MKAKDIKEGMHIKLGAFEDEPEQCAKVCDAPEDDDSCLCVYVCRCHIHHHLDGGSDDGLREIMPEDIVCEVTECIPKVENHLPLRKDPVRLKALAEIIRNS